MLNIKGLYRTRLNFGTVATAKLPMGHNPSVLSLCKVPWRWSARYKLCPVPNVKELVVQWERQLVLSEKRIKQRPQVKILTKAESVLGDKTRGFF